MKSTASNGFYVQDVQEEDAAAFIKCFKDYPLSPGSTPILYEERVQLFSAALLFNERGTLPLTSDDPEGVIRFWSLHKPDHTLVGVGASGFYTPGRVQVLKIANHPDHRNQGYFSAWRAFVSKSIFPHYNITGIDAITEASPVFAGMVAILNKTKASGGNIDAGDRTSTNPFRDASGNLVAEKDLVTTVANSQSLTNNESDWSSVTFSIS